MKYIKMLGLAAVALVALMAFVGASSASATVFCKTEPNLTGTKGETCPKGWAYPAGTKNHEVNVGKVTLSTSFKTIECEESTIKGEIENEGSATETPKGPVSQLTFTKNCNCTVTVIKKGTQEFHWVPDTFNVRIISDGAETTVLCSTIFGTVHCIYVTEHEDIGEITGGETAKEKPAALVHINATTPRSPTQAICDEEAHWTGTYEVKEPQPVWFAKGT